MLQRIHNWVRSEKGQGIVEYALILAFVVAIAAVALSGNSGIGESIKSIFSTTGEDISSAGDNIKASASSE
ncbi:MAG: hypothetical protein IJ849_10945 [Selenomonadaceae bacterium]|nr:hypothetical protein [Selenomonadaceae bacterium]